MMTDKGTNLWRWVAQGLTAVLRPAVSRECRSIALRHLASRTGRQEFRARWPAVSMETGRRRRVRRASDRSWTNWRRSLAGWRRPDSQGELAFHGPGTGDQAGSAPEEDLQQRQPAERPPPATSDNCISAASPLTGRVGSHCRCQTSHRHLCNRSPSSTT